jgi:DNA-binding NarL/FixJ family response regulator
MSNAAPPIIRIAIIDDHPVVGQGTAAVLGRQPDLRVAGVAESLAAADAAGLTSPEQVDVLLLDLRLGDGSGLRLLQPAGADRVLPAIIVLTAYDYPQYAEAALALGAAGFVLKTAPVADLVGAIRRVAAGGLAFDVRPRPGGTVRLSPREQAVVQLVAEGRTNDEIGLALQIATKTVETHLSRIFERCAIGSRAELAARATREGWLEPPLG